MSTASRSPVGSMQNSFPQFQHPSHKLLVENGFKRRFYKSIKSFVLANERELVLVDVRLHFTSSTFAVALVKSKMFPIIPLITVMDDPQSDFWAELRMELLSASTFLSEERPKSSQAWRLYWASLQNLPVQFVLLELYASFILKWKEEHVQKDEIVYLKKEQESKKEMRKYKVGISLGKSMRNSGCQWKFANGDVTKFHIGCHMPTATLLLSSTFTRGN
ncbi:hypothetical protein OROHE_005613 [Orobanche hederae]